MTLYEFIKSRSKEIDLDFKEHYRKNKGLGLCIAPSTIYSLQYRKPRDTTYVILSNLLDVDVERLKSMEIK